MIMECPIDHAFTLNGKNISVIEDLKGSTPFDDTRLHGYIVELETFDYMNI
jgi:hypothetical protein